MTHPSKSPPTAVRAGRSCSAVIGAVTGMGVAYLIAQRANRQGGEVSLSTGEGLRLGLLVLGMLRQVADLASPDED